MELDPVKQTPLCARLKLYPAQMKSILNLETSVHVLCFVIPFCGIWIQAIILPTWSKYLKKERKERKERKEEKRKEREKEKKGKEKKKTLL